MDLLFGAASIQVRNKISYMDRMISIYKLYIDGRNECYIGSTKRDPAERLLEHGRLGNKCASRTLFKLGTVKMEVLDTCDHNSRDAVEKRYILNTPGAINRCLPGDIVWSNQNPKRPTAPSKRPSSQKSSPQPGPSPSGPSLSSPSGSEQEQEMPEPCLTS